MDEQDERERLADEQMRFEAAAVGFIWGAFATIVMVVMLGILGR